MPSMAKNRSRLRTGRNPSVWVFDGYLMAGRKTVVAGAMNRSEGPEIRGVWVFDGYLMARRFAAGKRPRTPLDKMTPNQPSFVKSNMRHNRAKRREQPHRPAVTVEPGWYY